MKKGILCILITAIIALAACQAGPEQYSNDAPDIISVAINGEPIDLELPPVVQDDSVLLPVDDVFEALGCLVYYYDWVSPLSMAVADIGRRLYFNVGETDVKISTYDQYGKDTETVWEADVPAQEIDGRAFISMRLFSEVLGYEVRWDKENQTIDIQLPETPELAVMPKRGWNLLCYLTEFADDLNYCFDDNTTAEDIMQKYLFYETTRDLLYRENEVEIIDSETPSDPKGRLSYYAVIDGKVTDTIMRELFGANDADIERLHSIDTDTAYYYDGAYYCVKGDIGGPYLEAFDYEITGSSDGSIEVRIWIDRLIEGSIGYRMCTVVPYTDGSAYPFHICSISEYVETDTYESEWY